MDLKKLSQHVCEGTDLGALGEVVLLARLDDLKRGGHLGGGQRQLDVQLGEGIQVVKAVHQLLL